MSNSVYIAEVPCLTSLEDNSAKVSFESNCVMNQLHSLMDKPIIKRGIVEHSLGLKSRFDKEVLMLEKTVS